MRISAGPLGDVLEGQARPGHFDGMLTVVAKLMQLTRCTSAYFSQKDAQQLVLIRRMVRDLDFPVRVVAVPTVREPDGLAMSSRNTYLTESDREIALTLSAALRAGTAAAAEGPSAIRRRSRGPRPRAARARRLPRPRAPRDPRGRAGWYRGEALLAVAARVGTTRLIDNLPVLVGRAVERSRSSRQTALDGQPGT